MMRMLTLLRTDFKESRPTGKTVCDFCLFLFISLLTPIFTLGKFDFSNSDIRPGNIPDFFSFAKYYPGISPSLSFTLALGVIYLGLVFLLLYRMRREIKVFSLPTYILLAFMVVRIFQVFMQPYGEQIYQYVVPVDGHVVDITYSGFTVSERFVTLIDDLCFYSYLSVLFLVIKSLGKKGKFLFRLLYVLIELVVLSMVIYSVLFESDMLINNFKFFFFHQNGNVTWLLDLKAYTTGRNVFGFFLLFGGIFSLADFIEKPKMIPFLLYLCYTLLSFLISSKTPFILLFLMGAVTLLMFPILYFRRNKFWSSLFVILAVSMIGFLLISKFVFPKFYHDNIEFLFHHFTAMATMYARKDLSMAGLSMIDTKHFFLGYSKYPFINIFQQYVYANPYLDQRVTYTCHNSFYDLLLYYGIFGLVFMAVFFGFLFSRLYSDMLAKKQKINFFYLLIWIALLFYSYSEPRFLLLEEGTSVFFAILLTFPYVRQEDSFLRNTLTRKL